MSAPPPAEDKSLSESLTGFLTAAKRSFVEVTEAGFTLVAFIVLVYILLGADSGPYVVSVVANLSGLVTVLTPQALVAVAIVVALTYVLRRRS